MSAEIVTLGDLDPALLEKWSKLGAAAIEPNPFFEQEVVLPASKWLNDGEDVALLVADDDGGAWSVCVPVTRRRGWHRVPLACLSSWRHPYCFCGTPLIAPGPEGVAGVAAILDLAVGHPGAAFFGMDLVGGDGPASRAIAMALELVRVRETVFSEESRGGLRRGSPAGIEGMSKKRRHEAQRTRRRLAEHLGSELRTVELSGSPEAVQEFISLEQSGWKGAERTAFGSVPGHDRLLIEMCENLAAQGRLQLLSLQTDDRVVAMKCNLRAGEVLFTFKIAFDEGLARYSPGKQLDLENIRIFNEEDSETVMDSCAEPTNQTINRMLPDRLGIRAAVYTRAGLRGLPAAGIVAAAAAGRNMRRGDR